MRNLSLSLLGASVLAFASYTTAQATSGHAMILLTNDMKLVRINTSNPSVALSSVSISGLQAGEILVGIDERPATGELYGIGSSNRVYRLNVDTGAATAVGAAPFATALSGIHFGMDFNPTVDRIRLVSRDGQNLRIHPDTGAVASVDMPLKYSTTTGDVNQTKQAMVVAAGYTNNFAGATTTVLYDLDLGTPDTFAAGFLVKQIPPNDGILNTVGSVGIAFARSAALDIAADNTAYASLDDRNDTFGAMLYTMDLATGTPTLRGAFPAGVRVADIAVDLEVSQSQ